MVGKLTLTAVLPDADRPLTWPKTDIVKTYVDWAVKHKFAVIDVNLPKHDTRNDADREGHEETDSVEYRTAEATTLLTYLWENYIELGDATHVFLMGTNTGHGAIVNFIKSHDDQATNKIDKAISFVEDVSLISCKSQTNDLLHTWYHTHSMVFVSQEHNWWSTEHDRRRSTKRFGRVAQSPKTSVSDMLHFHKDQVFRSLLEETEDWNPEKAASEDDMDTGASSPQKLPPVSNFALSSPARTTVPSGGAATRSPARNISPAKMPPVSNFALSPRR